MATSTAPIEQSVDSQIQSENITYQVWVKLTDEGNVIEKETTYRATVADPNKEQEANEKLSKAGYQLARVQTVKGYTVKSTGALEELIGDPDEAGNIGNRGLQAKFNQKIKEWLTAMQDGKFVNADVDVLDSRELLQEPTQRRNLSIQDKLARDFKKSGLSEEVIAAMMATLQAAMTK